RQILINLIGNAVKFTERGCVEVIAGITPTAQPDVGRWCVDVRDSGIGMTSEQAESVFDEYAQADDSMVRRFGGSGLGLTISRRLARAMAGDLVVADCAIGSGTTMRLTVELPFAVGATPAPAEANGPPPRLDGCRVLVVDDAADNRALMDGVLTTSGALVQCVEDGLQAVELLTAPDAAAFDLILMDLQMPRMDGLEATRRLRASGVTAPIVALTASTCEEHRVASIAAGCDGHLGKPIQGRALLRAIHDVLARGCVGAAPASR
ncbi:MAG: response regulator, partial [Planctomycetes bacterium]|nr:response regulator [Planctomycetota bacterium]